MKRWALLTVLVLRLAALVVLGVIVAFAIPQDMRTWDFLGLVATTCVGYLATYTADYFAFVFLQSKGHPNDVVLFRDLVELLKPSKVLNELKHVELGTTFREELILEVMQFAEEWGNADKVFIDKKLEKVKKQVHAKAYVLANEIAMRTVWAGPTAALRTTKYSVNSEEMRRKAYEDAKVIQGALKEFVANFEKLYRLGQSRLILRSRENR